jgi:hypothetical protein
MGHGGDRIGRAEFAAEATILCTEITLTSEEGRRGEPEGGGGPIDHGPSASAKRLPAGDAMIGTEAQPGRKVMLVFPAGHQGRLR